MQMLTNKRYDAVDTLLSRIGDFLFANEETNFAV
jgi:hypothetical protein